MTMKDQEDRYHRQSNNRRGQTGFFAKSVSTFASGTYSLPVLSLVPGNLRDRSPTLDGGSLRVNFNHRAHTEDIARNQQ